MIDETYEAVHGEVYEPDALAVGNPTQTVDDRHDGALRVRGDDVTVVGPVPDDHTRHEARLRVLADGATSAAVGQPLDLFRAAGVEAVAGPRTSAGVGVGDSDGESPEALLAERDGRSSSGRSGPVTRRHTYRSGR